MNISKCTLNNITYSSIDFSRLPRTEIERLRHNLFCIQCGGYGFFRKASSDGKMACFGAEHFEQCSEYAPSEGKKARSEVAVLVSKIIASNDILNLDLGFHMGYIGTQPDDPVNGVKRGGKSKGKKHSLDPASDKIGSVNLIKVLRLLIHSPLFSQSDILINTGAKHPFKAKNLFVNFKDVNKGLLERYNGRTWRGYWGMIKSCTKDWIACGDVFIKTSSLNQREMVRLMQKLKFSEYEDFVGSYLLVLGTLRESKSDKFYIKVDEEAPFSFQHF